MHNKLHNFKLVKLWEEVFLGHGMVKERIKGREYGPWK
jgi:hypothetical protein